MFSLVPVWAKAALIAAVFVVGAAGGWWLTRDHYTGVIAKNAAAQAKAVIDAQNKARDAQISADQITHDRDVQNAIEHQQIETVTKTIIRKVPVYVTAETDKLFPLPCGFLRLHDAAALSVDPAAISLPAEHDDEERCDVTASLAATVIAQNYALALGWKADLKTWWGWYDDQKANYDAYVAKLARGQ